MQFKALEGVFSEVKADAPTSNPSESHAANKMEKNSIRTRGSSSPFRCISSLVQQMNLEKDQELSVARHQIEELEALAADRQKEVICPVLPNILFPGKSEFLINGYHYM